MGGRDGRPRVNRVTCEEAFQWLDDYLDRELGAEETRLIEEQLSICAACLREFTFERSAVDGVRQKLPEVKLDASNALFALEIGATYRMVNNSGKQEILRRPPGDCDTRSSAPRDVARDAPSRYGPRVRRSR
jgi:hypothetical protein